MADKPRIDEQERRMSDAATPAAWLRQGEDGHVSAEPAKVE